MTTEVKTLVAIFAGTAIILGSGVWFMSRNQANIPADTSGPVDPAILVKSDSISRGPADAKVTLVEFGDFQCPSCAQAAPILDKIYTEYQGKVRFVFRNYPLPQHAHARKAAEAAESAHDQGKFWEMFDKIYAGQPTWENVSNEKADITFTTYAQELGLDMNKFNATYTKDAHKDRIQADLTDGNSAGVNATPTFYLNNKKVEGVRNYEEFKAKIDAALK